MPVAEIELPTPEVAEEAREALQSLSGLVRSRSLDDVQLRARRDGNSVEVRVPHTAYRLFLEMLAQLANGNAVTIVPIHAELTTQEAADMLNVSRPFFVGLLESGTIPFRRVGTHRRILAQDLFKYKADQDARGEAALRELAQLSQDAGLYK
jgi:excisionase family DNA binding protein